MKLRTTIAVAAVGLLGGCQVILGIEDLTPAGGDDGGAPDAAAGTPDAPVGTPDAPVGTPDAAPPDAGPTSLAFVDDIKYGGTADDRARDIVAADGALFVAGQVYFNNAFVLRYTNPPTDTPVWSNDWPTSPNRDVFEAITAGPDAIYAVGSSESQTTDCGGGKEGKIAIVKYPFDGSGPLWYSWYSNLGGACAIEVPGSALAVTEGTDTFVYVGAEIQYSHGPSFIKVKDPGTTNAGEGLTGTDGFAPVQSGFPLFAGGSDSYFSDIVRVGDDLCFSSYSYGGSGTDNPVLGCFSKTGGVLWTQSGIGTVGFNGHFHSIAEVGGDIYAGAYRRDGTAGTSDLRLERWDPSGTGTRTWFKDYDFGSVDEGAITGIAAIGDRVFAVGSTQGGSGGGYDIVVLEIDPADGTILDMVEYGGAGDEFPEQMIAVGDDLFVVGFTNTDTAGSNDALLLHFTLAP